MAIRSKPPSKPRGTKAREAATADKFERENWPEVERKVATARASVAKGKARKWDLDRTLSLANATPSQSAPSSRAPSH